MNDAQTIYIVNEECKQLVDGLATVVERFSVLVLVLLESLPSPVRVNTSAHDDMRDYSVRLICQNLQL